MQLGRLLVPQVEEAVPGVVGVQPHLGAGGLPAALDAHLEGLLAAHAELVLALAAGEVHTPAPRQRVAELARRALDAVLAEVTLQPGGLVVGVVVLLPFGKVLAADVLVRVFPLKDKIVYLTL